MTHKNDGSYIPNLLTYQLEFETFKKIEIVKVLEGAALRPKNMKKHVSGAPDTRPFAFSKTQNLSFSDLRSPSSNPPFPFSNFLKIGKILGRVFRG